MKYNKHKNAMVASGTLKHICNCNNRRPELQLVRKVFRPFFSKLAFSGTSLPLQGNGGVFSFGTDGKKVQWNNTEAGECGECTLDIFSNGDVAAKKKLGYLRLDGGNGSVIINYNLRARDTKIVVNLIFWIRRVGCRRWRLPATMVFLEEVTIIHTHAANLGKLQSTNVIVPK